MRYFKRISVLLIFTMILPFWYPATRVHAATVDLLDQCDMTESTDNTYVQIEEDSSMRVATYFEDGVKKQIAILDKTTQEVLYYDLSSTNVSDIEIAKANMEPIRYHISEFISIEKNDQTIDAFRDTQRAVNAGQNFTFLKSKTFQSSGETYRRYLYGYTDTRQYKEHSWEFAAGTALSVICAVVGTLYPAAVLIARISSVVSVVGGFIADVLTVSYWVKESFWVYKFKQTSPTTLEIVCPSHSNFVYKKERRVELSGDEGYWDVIEEKEDWEIEKIRDDILTSPGLYI